MFAASDIDPILDAIDWDAPTGLPTEDRYRQSTADANPWEMVKANRGSGGVDGQSLDGFVAQWASSWTGRRAN